MTSPGIVAAPNMPTHSADRSCAAVSACRSATYLLGTPQTFAQRLGAFRRPGRAALVDDARGAVRVRRFDVTGIVGDVRLVVVPAAGRVSLRGICTTNVAPSPAFPHTSSATTQNAMTIFRLGVGRREGDAAPVPMRSPTATSCRNRRDRR